MTGNVNYVRSHLRNSRFLGKHFVSGVILRKKRFLGKLFVPEDILQKKRFWGNVLWQAFGSGNIV